MLLFVVGGGGYFGHLMHINSSTKLHIPLINPVRIV